MSPLVHPRVVVKSRLGASLAVAMGLAACGPVTAPVTGAYGPGVTRPATAPAQGPAPAQATAPSQIISPAPPGGPGVIKVVPLPAPQAESAQPRAEKPSTEVAGAHEHIVQPGETVYSIARRYNVATADLMRVNAIPPAFTIKTGQRLVLPDGLTPAGAEGAQAGGESARTDPLQPAAPGLAATGAAGETQPASAPAASSAAIPELAHAPPIAPRGGEAQPGAERNSAHAASLASLTPPAHSSARAFLWPVKGRVISDYGSKGQGLKNDGINIAAPRGTPVRAAENGVVAYTGNELKGFGNLILIRHADGWVTAYAHNEALLVAKGDTVRRGQPIARVGTSGNVREPQLHFEMRRSRVAVDPTQYLDGDSGPGERPQALNPSVSRDGPPSPG